MREGVIWAKFQFDEAVSVGPFERVLEAGLAAEAFDGLWDRAKFDIARIFDGVY